MIHGVRNASSYPFETVPARPLLTRTGLPYRTAGVPWATVVVAITARIYERRNGATANGGVTGRAATATTSAVRASSSYGTHPRTYVRDTLPRGQLRRSG
jgi:hypothetical protein